MREARWRRLPRRPSWPLGPQCLIVDLARGFAAAVRSTGKRVDRGDAIARGPQRIRGLVQAKTQGADDAGSDDRDPVWFLLFEC